MRQRYSAVERAERIEDRLAKRPRLTDVERSERDVLEDDFQLLVTGLAEHLGWAWVHVRPGVRANGRWWTPTIGPLAAWPDLVLVRPRDRRLVFAELKRELKDPSPEQVEVLDTLGALRSPDDEILASLSFAPRNRIDVVVWRPSDLRDPIETSRIYEALR